MTRWFTTAGAAVARAQGSDAILAIGGGSSIDAAKIIAASATSDESPRDWVGFGKSSTRCSNSS